MSAVSAVSVGEGGGTGSVRAIKVLCVRIVSKNVSRVVIEGYDIVGKVGKVDSISWGHVNAMKVLCVGTLSAVSASGGGEARL